jgi:predicted site-specific integrase-resolvase
LERTAALYCRVSTVDQTCARQERDLRAFAKKAGYKIVGVWKETASGAKDDRAERKEVLALAQAILQSVHIRFVKAALRSQATQSVSFCGGSVQPIHRGWAAVAGR